MIIEQKPKAIYFLNHKRKTMKFKLRPNFEKVNQIISKCLKCSYIIYTLLSIHVYTLYTILLNINNYVLNYCNDFIQIELIWKMINKNENLEEVFRILCTFKFVLNNPEPSLEGIYFLCARIIEFYCFITKQNIPLF